MTTVDTEPRARFRDLLAAEWIKLWTLRSMTWAIGLSALLVTLMNAGAAFTDYKSWWNFGQPVRDGFVPDYALNDAYTMGAGMVTILLAGGIGAVAVAGEYGTGLIRTTFAAVPARRSVMAAKVTVVAAVFCGWGAVVATVSFFASQAILAGRDVGMSISYPGVARAVTASALLAPVCALVGTGVASLVRHAAAAVGGTLGVLLLLPAVLNSQRGWVLAVDHAMPLGAWQRLTTVSDMSWRPDAASIGGSWAVYAIWPVVAVVIALVAVHRRDP